MPTLNVPQSNFLALSNKFRAFVGGFGSGKTWVGCDSLAIHSWQFPKVNAGYFAPSYPQIRDIFYPTMEEVAFDCGLKTQVNFGNKEVHIYSGSRYRNTIICRSMDNPNSIVGFKIGHALCDEIDTMKRDKAQMAWRKIIARMRYKVDGLKNGIDVTTTPEGFNFVYDQFVKSVREKPELAQFYGLIQASTYDNAKNLPPDYITSLKASYPPQLVEAYLNGQFVNLNSGTVYNQFDRYANHNNAIFQAAEPLHIGMDFNVLNMAAVVFVLRDGLPIAVDEITGVRDTPTMADLLKERYANHAMTIYPDASGQNRSSKNYAQSDLNILKSAGFTIRVDSTNPSVRDRVNAVNALLLNGNGERRFKINTHRCPKLTEALEQQAYDSNSEPDKSGGHDHILDAMGYPLVKLFPIKGKPMQHQRFSL
ncbi:terminase large subunit domain-containing protein [Wielerella bovis]|uniref:terminase large subunit domain-containing protein n=1 Tax=Wielerella bovis TaxID=2917790 RepID=UPI002019D0FB|nr:terminase family protein [Wielerella bovis]ULJ65927.1 terminase large subunit [Wielerella bovis]